MTEKEILQKIIDNNGSCDFSGNWYGNSDWYTVNKDLCHICPLSRLKKNSDNSWMSCSEAVLGNVSFDSVKEFMEAFKKQAIEILQDIEMEDLIKNR